MQKINMNETGFLILYHSAQAARLVRVAVESLRAFGGLLRNSPVWLFLPDPDLTPPTLPGLDDVDYLPLAIPEACRAYPFAAKVAACARAEALAGPEIGSLVWLSLDTLIVNPPLLFDLAPAAGKPAADVAFRPVHHRNIGSPVAEPLDPFWQAVYRALAMDEAPYTARSFADDQILRPYFNSHCFAFNPATGLARKWWAHFEALVADEAFQAGPCQDRLHQIFLHQAILSTLVARMLPRERVRLLPPEYNYPLNLLHELPPARRVPVLNRLVTAVYEDAFPWNEIEIHEPLHSWLLGRMPGIEST